MACSIAQKQKAPVSDATGVWEGNKSGREGHLPTGTNFKSGMVKSFSTFFLFSGRISAALIVTQSQPGAYQVQALNLAAVLREKDR
jgi:hypothetical protein